ncbi:MAG TPA: ABC transporter substrate-binding protein [Gammaproteobacteria bacterium]|nr:ABC transporter substrate-binding protein [Gammaproteobacteria bacterium]
MAAALSLLALLPVATRAACPQRLVTLGGDITEIVFALGAGECVVADDTTSEYPAAAQALPKVGYLRALNAEGVIALEPQTVIASAEAGPPAVITQLRAAGIKVDLIPEQHTAEGTLAKIEAVAKVLGRAPAGAVLAASVRTSLATLARQLSAVTSQKRVIFLLTVGNGTPMAGGTGTAADGIITLAGGINAAQGFSGYKPLGAEAMVRLKPDVILVMSEAIGSHGGPDFVYGLPGVRLTPAGRGHHVIAMDGSLMLGFGPRLGEAARTLAAALYPEQVTQHDVGAR